MRARGTSGGAAACLLCPPYVNQLRQAWRRLQLLGLPVRLAGCGRCRALVTRAGAAKNRWQRCKQRAQLGKFAAAAAHTTANSREIHSGRDEFAHDANSTHPSQACRTASSRRLATARWPFCRASVPQDIGERSRGKCYSSPAAHCEFMARRPLLDTELTIGRQLPQG